MERVLIVAKTHVIDKLCIGGLNLRTNQSVRLLLPGGHHHPRDTPFTIGQVWDFSLRAVPSPTPPHIEDIIIGTHSYLQSSYSSIQELLLQHIEPWKGGLSQLFEGCLQSDGDKCYITRAYGLPSCSTGYWLTTIPLTLSHIYGKDYYRLNSVARKGQEFYRATFSIRYVGVDDPIPEIPANTLVRVSLARWWRRDESVEERCYLQISGWYL